ncbi:AraC family transcriptional regulator [Microbispora corallina]|uniref:Transcriptional regulator n=1 Tax=Microbispora corallina TaxID=83302 RepID=A0ABQ4G2P4_9ACTN|nr:AraC family transcriptional regulator [Microbispora corallina]GIH41300.1 transcriptional regulator [Microbispora corallina]
MAQDWSRYWRSADQPLEAMRAHFTRHRYHRHSHETYSFGVTEEGAQAFTCRGASHTSATGMVLAFNPDDPHDGHAADELGFTYRIVHIGPELVTGVLADATGGRGALPLFPRPVVEDRVLARDLLDLHRALIRPATALRREEALAAAVASIVRRAAVRGPGPAEAGERETRRVAERARARLREAPLADVTAGDLAAAAGCSRFAIYRAFRSVYGMAPSDYQRQLRLRHARTLIGHGTPLSEAAVRAGFADQSHLTRWFVRSYGITPGEYRNAAG